MYFHFCSWQLLYLEETKNVNWGNKIIELYFDLVGHDILLFGLLDSLFVGSLPLYWAFEFL